jgi:hypothetical protein
MDNPFRHRPGAKRRGPCHPPLMRNLPILPLALGLLAGCGSSSPPAQRARGDVVNIVDGALARQAAAFLDDGIGSLDPITRAFYGVYGDDYDFIYVVTER